MPLGILCPGQGAQHPDMLSMLTGEPAAEAVFGAAQAVLGWDLRQLVSQGGDEIHRNVVAQPLLCATQLATWNALRARLPTPRVIAGYSVGELAAYACAGALEAGQVVELARRRAEAMDRACPDPSGLLAVRGITRERLEPLCRRHRMEIAIVNDVDRLVVGGRSADLIAFQREVTGLGAGITPMRVSIASHTSLLNDAVPEFAAQLGGSGLQAPVVPVLAGIDGGPVFTRQRAVETLSRQIARTVQWAACIGSLREMGCTVLLELGPSNGLSRMVRERYPDLAVRSVAEFRSLQAVAEWVERQGP
jgi:[acyl-carrier-protein] S-malonyltransferase